MRATIEELVREKGERVRVRCSIELSGLAAVGG